MNYPERKTIFVDVDGTLLINNQINRRLTSWIKTQWLDGYEIIIWSMQGAKYADKICRKANLENYVTHCISKPGTIVDDEGWTWIKNCKKAIVNPSLNNPPS